MALYAVYDTNSMGVTGWLVNHPEGLAAAGILEITQEQFDDRMSGPWVVVGGLLATPTLSLAQQAVNAMAAGLTISDSTFAVDAEAQMHVNSEINSIVLFSTFADGTETVIWPDMSGTTHTFTVVEFKAFAAAVNRYVAALMKVINGTSTTLPSAKS